MVKKVPSRVCIGCRQAKSKKELIRIVNNKEEGFSIDNTGKKAGRGAYICPDVECLNKAFKDKALEQSFKEKIDVEVKDRLLKQLEELIGQ